MISGYDFEKGIVEIAVLCGNLKCTFSVKSYYYRGYKKKEAFS